LTVQQTIKDKIQAALAPEHLEVINESHMHNVPPGSESHFKVIVVSTLFECKSRVERHQNVNSILADELAGSVHALSMQTHTATEWEERSRKIIKSPNCRGGSL